MGKEAKQYIFDHADHIPGVGLAKKVDAGIENVLTSPFRWILPSMRTEADPIFNLNQQTVGFRLRKTDGPLNIGIKFVTPFGSNVGTENNPGQELSFYFQRRF